MGPTQNEKHFERLKYSYNTQYCIERENQIQTDKFHLFTFILLRVAVDLKPFP